MTRPAYACHDWRYKTWEPYGRYTCAYCGDPATTEDHVPPLAMVDMMAGTCRPDDIPECFTVPACRECNCLLGSEGLDTLRARREYVRTKLRQRYRSVLAMGEWTDDELSEMGDSMVQHIRQGLVERRRVEARLLFPKVA